MISFKIVDSPTNPKYLQLAEAIVEEIQAGNLALNQRLPSVNKLSRELHISRETVFKALNHLSEKGVIKSANRRGYYIQKISGLSTYRVFLLMDKVTPFKDLLYHSFVNTIGDQGSVDIFFHHHNRTVFQDLIQGNLQNYTHFVIVTFFRESIGDILNLIPPEKRIILDSFEPDLEGEYGMVYQDFSTDIYDSLKSAEDILRNYQRIIMVAPGSMYHIDWVKTGFRRFCEENNIIHKIIPNVDPQDFHQGDVYLTTSGYDVELVEVIKLSRARQFEVGKDIGIISYNDIPMKEVLEGGITVISTDFEQMGKTAAQMILDRDIKKVANPTKLILRNSLS